MGIPIMTATIIARMPSSSVTSSRLLSSVLTSSPARTLFPKSPWMALPIQSKYRTSTGRSSPSCCRIASTVFGSASSPSTARTGSPGSSATAKNVISEMRMMTGIVASSRRAM